jgi:hypothetical protein
MAQDFGAIMEVEMTGFLDQGTGRFPMSGCVMPIFLLLPGKNKDS